MCEMGRLLTNCTSMARVRSHHFMFVSGFNLLVSTPVQTFMSLVVIVAVAVAVTATATEAFAVVVEFIVSLEL